MRRSHRIVRILGTMIALTAFALGLSPDATAQPTAPPVPDLSQTLSSGPDPWAPGFIGAVVGALATLIGDRLVQGHFEKKALRALLRQALQEITLTEVATREARSSDTPPNLNFEPVASSECWKSIVTSGLFWRLAREPSTQSALHSYYSQCDVAEKTQSLALALFTLSQDGNLSDDLSLAYAEQAARALSTSRAELQTRAQAARSALLQTGLVKNVA